MQRPQVELLVDHDSRHARTAVMAGNSNAGHGRNEAVKTVGGAPEAPVAAVNRRSET